jgi:phosphomannomutase
VPEISRFFGIVIAMYHREHEPAHFHARYGRPKGTVRIEDGYVVGHFPPRVRALILEWWDLHRRDLAENWRLAKERKELRPIPPLE